MAHMGSARRLVLGVVALGFSAARASSQYVPIRELDSNALLQYEDVSRMAGDLVVGGEVATGYHWLPVFWDASGSHFLPLLSGFSEGNAAACNAAGTIVGFAYEPTVNLVAVVWENGVATDLNTRVTSGGPASLFEANDIDEKERILVNGELPSKRFRTFRLDAGSLVDLGALDPTYGDSFGYAMNEHGAVVGSSTVNNGLESHACLFENGQVVDLHDSTLMEDISVASGVNRHGHVVGTSHPSFVWVSWRAFLWDGTRIVDLVAPNGGSVAANAISDFGVVVGATWDPVAMTGSACLWEDGVFVDLNALVDPSLGWVLQYATDVDEQGRIIGSGTLNGVWTAWILEPDCNGSFTIYGNGCAGAGGVEPQLRGAGCPAPDRDFALEIVDGQPGGFGFLVVGLGTGVIPVRPGCDL